MFLRKEFLIVLFFAVGLVAFSYYEPKPLKRVMDWRATRNALAEGEVNLSEYQVYDRTNGKEPKLTVDFVKGKHFWNPQMVIWIEDSVGNYLETLLITTSTAKGLFYSGRTSENFRESDGPKTEESTPTRRVDALPYWSHKRGQRYEDGFYSPPPSQPLPDGITRATPKGNFYFESATDLNKLSAFKILVEVNVAFDENEYYSEYDFVDDSVYHSGTGLLGQPSLIYSADIRNTDSNRHYVLSLAGRGHHSGATGDLIPELESITTARYVVDRIVVGVSEDWYRTSENQSLQ
jgi:hypothetical protein